MPPRCHLGFDVDPEDSRKYVGRLIDNLFLDVVVSNTGYWMGPDITVATANQGPVPAHGRAWDFDGRSAEICQISWPGPN